MLGFEVCVVVWVSCHIPGPFLALYITYVRLGLCSGGSYLAGLDELEVTYSV